MEKTHIQLWEECLRIFADNLSQQQFDTWFRPVTSLGFEGGNLTLSVPTAFFVEQLEERFMRIIAPTLMRVYGAGVKLFYSYHPVKEAPEAAVTQQSERPSAAVQRHPANPFQEIGRAHV